jgi:AcrR family transcriptional regulator
VQYAVDDGVWMQLVDHVAGVADDRGDTQRVVADGERTAQTRVTLITAARRLFGAEGFAEVGAERVARGLA